MKYVMIREHSWDISKDKVILGKIKRSFDNNYDTVTLAYLKTVIEDFNQSDQYIIIRNTESIQIRPKAIYKDNNGYYRKEDNKKVYFNGKDLIEIQDVVKDFEVYLNVIEEDK